MSATTTTTETMNDLQRTVLRLQAEAAEASWFDAPPPSNRASTCTSAPPVPVGEFLGDPEVDGWLR